MLHFPFPSKNAISIDSVNLFISFLSLLIIALSITKSKSSKSSSFMSLNLIISPPRYPKANPFESNFLT